MKGKFRWYAPRARQTRWYRFLGMNIKGTPAMSADKVEHDLEVARSEAHVLVVQEFRWPWYWRVAKAVMAARTARWRDRWATSPGLAQGFAAPVRGAQAVLWVRGMFKRRRTWVRLLHKGRAGISESRFQRAVLLEDKATGLAFIAWTSHAVVRGDNREDPNVRESMLATDLTNIDGLLSTLKSSGFPIIGQADLNIYATSDARARLDRIMERHGATLHGNEAGVEYLFTIPGTRARVEVQDAWEVPTRRLFTDHEGRGITFRLVRL